MSTPHLDLPAGYTARPLTRDDAAGVVAVMTAQQLRDLGEPVIELADIEAEWARPSFDPATQTIGVLDDAGALVAYGEVSEAEYGDASVHPDHEGRGLGTAIAGWLGATARARGAAWIGMPVPAGSAGDLLLGSLGWEVRWDSWVLELPPGDDVPPRPLPPGLTLRAARPDEHEACFTVNEDAFAEWATRERSTYADWCARVTERPGFEPDLLRVVVEEPADGGPAEVLGMLVLNLVPGDEHRPPEGFVDRLAVRADQRGRGLAQALLADAFAHVRGRGIERCTLSTDSRTGALGLYEKVGMQVTSTWRHRGLRLT